MGRHLALPDIDAKLAGAEDLLKELKGRIDQGAVTELVTTRADRDGQGRVCVRVEQVAEIPPKWHVWIGECVHDMRSALDHLAYAAFPIFSRRRKRPWRPGRDGFRKMARKPPDQCPIGYFPRGARTRIERFQPYHGWNDIDTGWLEILAELSNIDKHRAFPVTPVVPQTITSPNRVEGLLVTEKTFAPLRALEPNAPLLWLTVPGLPRSIQEPDVPLAYSADLNFKRKTPQARLPLVMGYEPVDFILGSILEHIRERVLPAFEEFLR